MPESKAKIKFEKQILSYPNLASSGEQNKLSRSKQHKLAWLISYFNIKVWFKDIFDSFFFSIDFYYIYIHLQEI